MSVRSSPSPLPRWAGVTRTRVPSTTVRVTMPRDEAADQWGVGMSVLPVLPGRAGQDGVDEAEVVLVGQPGGALRTDSADARRGGDAEAAPDRGSVIDVIANPDQQR